MTRLNSPEEKFFNNQSFKRSSISKKENPKINTSAAFDLRKSIKFRDQTPKGNR